VERARRGWEQETLAEKAGISRVTVSNIERAKTDMMLETLEALAQAFSMPMSKLVEEET
jgi:transcriptional regulator with XRE-family HTH domain